MAEGRVKVPRTKVSSGISERTHYMSSPNVKLSYCRAYSWGMLVFSMSCSLSAGLAPVTNKYSSIHSWVSNGLGCRN
ncbi:BgTH12-07297 [Blumeria graminis f. sp. triticale]|uniref:Bgt-51935 n=2 Tax=Blumeria graminis TaxID=34373 RepID=A0A9X9MQQ3_BLUGR|nr:BgTH12-07297 [Blumeria graminis f. sp. triticale]VDB95154.1 Bgt-51935 [Blumeria graminis f. sp. tritici]